MELEALLALVGPATSFVTGIASLIAQARAVNSTTDPAVIQKALDDLKAANETLYQSVMAKLQAEAGA